MGWLTTVLLLVGAVMAGCSGGAGGGPGPTAGALTVTVSDVYGAPVPSATVMGRLGTTEANAATNALGVALFTTTWPSGTAEVTVSRSTFVDKTVSATIVAGQVNEVAVVLDRATSAAGGSKPPGSGELPQVAPGGDQLTFEVDVVVVDAAGLPVAGLSTANFALRDCAPDPATTRADCVGGSGGASDAAYVASPSAPASVQRVDAAGTQPYAAALLIDQSGSIAASDPTGARLFSAKSFIGALGADDRMRLAAFAAAPGALIATPPLADYGPFRDRAAAASYFTDLDALAPLVGGNTPLYASLDTVRAQLAADAAVPTGTSKAIVVFTDGADTTCGGASTCASSRASVIAAAQASGVRIFAIGLSRRADVEALAELAGQTGGTLLYADSAEQLIPLYGSVGRLLSQSAPAYRLRFTAQAGAAGVFQSGATLLGRVQVTLPGGGGFDVPVAVAIP